jgi:menaquinone-specific isochorismate synthase
VADILVDLHPTAAVAGSPTPAAIDLIREIEPTSRGRYAGPVGWIDPDGDGVFAIALRCGQIEGRHIRLYSGGGLVAGSEAEAELEETELKLAPMLTALGQS